MLEYDIIKSNQNPFVVRFSKLKDVKFRRKESLFISEGNKLVLEALRSGKARYLLVRADVFGLYEEIIEKYREYGVRIFVLSESPFSKISTEKAPQGIIAVCDTSLVSKYTEFTGTMFICSGIRDPGNLGTIIRSAAGFGYDAVVLHECVDVYNPKVVRSSMGGIFKTILFESEDLIRTISDLQNVKRRVLACTLTGDSYILGRFDIRSNDVLIVGNEGHGLDDSVVSACDGSVCILMKNGVDSFNAAIASAVIQWEQSKTFS